MTPEQRSAFASAYQELIAAEMIDADRPEAHLNLGLLKTRRQQLSEAEAEYRTALRLDPKFVPALVNLADLDRQRGMDKEGAELLRAAIAIEPNNAAIKHSLGLLLVANVTTPKPYRCCARPPHLIPTTRVTLTSTPSHSTPSVQPPRQKHFWSERTSSIRPTGMYYGIDRVRARQRRRRVGPNPCAGIGRARAPKSTDPCAAG